MTQLDTDLFAAQYRSKRGDLGPCKVASATEVSAATLSRLEYRKIPGMDTFLALLDWIGWPSRLSAISTAGA